MITGMKKQQVSKIFTGKNWNLSDSKRVLRFIFIEKALGFSVAHIFSGLKMREALDVNVPPCYECQNGERIKSAENLIR